VAIVSGASGLGACFLAILMGRGWLRSEGTVGLAIGAIILLGLGITAWFMAVRIWKSPLPPEAVDPLAPEHMWALKEFQEDILATEEWPKNCPGYAWWNEANRRMTETPSAAVGELEQLVADHPLSVRFSHALTVNYLALGRWADARQEVKRISSGTVRDGTRTLLWWTWLETVLANGETAVAEDVIGCCLTEVPDRGKSLVLDHAACWAFMKPPGSQNLPLADRLSNEALRLAPQSATVQGTRGSVLMELGQTEEARAMLESVYRESDAPVNRGFSSLYLAIAAARRGEPLEAERYAKEARQFQPVGFVSDRLKVEEL
jgi:tetratricopeptide (TPR) repeat protein